MESETQFAVCVLASGGRECFFLAVFLFAGYLSAIEWCYIYIEIRVWNGRIKNLLLERAKMQHFFILGDQIELI